MLVENEISKVYFGTENISKPMHTFLFIEYIFSTNFLNTPQMDQPKISASGLHRVPGTSTSKQLFPWWVRPVTLPSPFHKCCDLYLNEVLTLMRLKCQDDPQIHSQFYESIINVGLNIT